MHMLNEMFDARANKIKVRIVGMKCVNCDCVRECLCICVCVCVCEIGRASCRERV